MNESRTVMGLTVPLVVILPFVDPNQLTKYAPEGNCSYSIEIETTFPLLAGATGAVGVRYRDVDGNLVIVIKHLINPKMCDNPTRGERNQGSAHGGFEQRTIGSFQTNVVCMRRTVCYLYLQLLLG
ncbi:hypothetical protein AAC387_Pa09g1777 [Persea americana]